MKRTRLELPGEDGWSRLDVGPGAQTFVREVEVDGRQVLSGIRVEVDGRPLRSIDLHAVPLTAIEHALNDPLRRAVIAGVGGPSSRAEAVRAAAAHRASLDVNAPTGRPYPDDFYRRVAAAYNALVSAGRSPAPALAEANSVPVTTVHGWTREARRRGALPPARKGKAG